MVLSFLQTQLPLMPPLFKLAWFMIKAGTAAYMAFGLAFILHTILTGWWAMITDPDYATLNQPTTIEIIHHA